MIARRLTLLLVAGVAVVATALAVADGRRSVAMFDDGVRGQLRAAGQVLQDAALAAYRAGGEPAARTQVRQAGERLGPAGIEARWVRLDAAPGSPLAPRVDPARLAALAAGGDVELAPGDGGERRFYFYAPALRGPPVAAVELSRTSTRRAAFVRAVVVDKVIEVAVVLLVLGLLALLLWSRQLRGFVNRFAAERRDAVEEATRGMAEHQELHAANRLVTVGKLAASMAHELGTPLGVVQARAQMLAAGEVPADEVRQEAAIIVEQTKRMEGMVREVLDLARAKAAVVADVNLAGLARRTVGLLEPLARKQNVRLRVDGELPPAPILGDASKLLQVLTNLVMNAAQAMPKGGTVWLGLERRQAVPPESHGGRTGEFFCLHVRDEGTGIQREHLTKVFDTFFTTKKEGEGTGLGLAVAYRIVREHGGWIAVTSEVDRGSTFTVYLPPSTPA